MISISKSGINFVVKNIYPQTNGSLNRISQKDEMYQMGQSIQEWTK